MGHWLDPGLQHFGKSWWLTLFPVLADTIRPPGLAVPGEDMAGFAGNKQEGRR
jgi:hypothetical protein